jgi:hypothetical protein
MLGKEFISSSLEKPIINHSLPTQIAAEISLSAEQRSEPDSDNKFERIARMTIVSYQSLFGCSIR